MSVLTSFAEIALLLFFFIVPGGTLDLSLPGTHVTGATAFSMFVPIGNPLIALLIMGAWGVSLGHVAKDALGCVTTVGLVTIAASTYMITYSQQFYALFEPVRGIFERRGTPREPSDAGKHGASGYVVILFGLGRFGTAIGLRLKKRGIRVLGEDFNPQALRRWRNLGLEAEFGEAKDAGFVAELPFRGAR